VHVQLGPVAGPLGKIPTVGTKISLPICVAMLKRKTSGWTQLGRIYK
jgi:hypothetical protein